MAKSNLNWEPSKIEVYAESFWKDNGYGAKLIKRYVSKSVYQISKDGLTDTYEIPNTVKDPARFVSEFERYWAIFKETENLRRQVQNMQNER